MCTCESAVGFAFLKAQILNWGNLENNSVREKNVSNNIHKQQIRNIQIFRELIL